MTSDIVQEQQGQEQQGIEMNGIAIQDRIQTVWFQNPSRVICMWILSPQNSGKYWVYSATVHIGVRV